MPSILSCLFFDRSILLCYAGISNAASVLRLPYAECLKMYVLFTWVPGIITTVAAVICLSVGLV